MSSKAQRKRIHRQAMSQRRGRPLKEGATRYKCGKAKVEPVGPSLDVVAKRAALLGITDPKVIAKLNTAFESPFAATESPLSFAVHRGWLSEEQERAGEAFRECFERASLDLPRCKTQDFAREPKGFSGGDGNSEAMTRYRELAEDFAHWPKAWAAVRDLCVLGQWPAWMIDRLGDNPRGEHNVAYAHLVTGLRIAGRRFGIGQEMGRAA